MKKFFLLSTVAFLFTGLVSAQDDTQMWAAASLSFSSSSYGSGVSTSSHFGFSPEFGYNINSEWAVGGRLDFAFGSSKFDPGFGVSSDKSTTTSTTFAPFARYSFIKSGDFSIFGQGEIPISFGDAPNTVGLRALPGVSYSLKNNFSIQALLPSILAFESGDNVTTFNFLSGGSSIGLVLKF